MGRSLVGPVLHDKVQELVWRFNNREEPEKCFVFLQLILHIYTPKNCADVCKNYFIHQLEENFLVNDVNIPLDVENLLFEK